MVTTIDAVKALANITDVTYNNQIEIQIPVVQELIREYTNNYFVASTLTQIDTNKGFEQYSSPKVSATGEFTMTGNTITAPSNEFGDFIVGDDILIQGSIRNNGYFTITEVTDTVITVEEDLSDEIESIYIYLIHYPKYIKRIATQMVVWDIFKRSKADGVKSLRFGSYSVTYKDICGIGYPQDVIAGLRVRHTYA